MSFRALLVVSLVCMAARGASKPLVVGFVAPLSGPLQERSEEYLAGVRQAAAFWSGSDAIGGREVQIVTLDDAKSYKDVAARLKREKIKLAALLGAPSAHNLGTFTKFARRKKKLFILLPPWEPVYTLDPKETLNHLSCGSVDHAIAAARYSLIPMTATKVVALHDGSGPSRALAGAYVRNLPRRIKEGSAQAIPATVREVRELLGKLKQDGIDLAFVCGEADASLRVAEAGVEGPPLLFADGLLTGSIIKAAPDGARFLEQSFPYLELSAMKHCRKGRSKKGLSPSPLAERGYAGMNLLIEALRAAEGKTKDLGDQLRKIAEPEHRAPFFTDWGQAKMFEFFLYEVKDKKPRRVNPLHLPSHSGGDLLLFRDPKKFTIDPESRMVLMTWGDEKKRTIEEDVARLGLTTKGYQPDMDDWVKDGLMARAMERLNRIFWRNPDGTPIPGVSFNITFGMELPKGAKGHKVWTTIVAGDDPRAGGRASAPYAFTFSSFLVRTMYLKRRLKQPLHYPDYKYFNGKYKWGSSLEENLRHDNIRSLIEGFSGAIALTTAHECGHLAGLGHDTQTPRSIMNVAEGGGLHPDYAEWVPPHIKTLDRGLKRVPAPRK